MKKNQPHKWDSFLQNILNFTIINLTNNKSLEDFYLPDISDYKEKDNLITGGAYLKDGKIHFID